MTVMEYGAQNRDTVVLLHGGGLSWWNYREVARLLEADYRVILPVLDGHAGSGEGFSSIEDNAARIIDYIDAHLGGQIAVLGGLSLGAQIALEILSRRPDICRAAMIESALVKPMKLTHTLIELTFGPSFGLIQQRWFARLQSSYLGIPQALFEEYYRDTCAITKADMIAFLKANCAYSLPPALSKTTARVAVLAGSREQKAILNSAKMLRDTIPESSLTFLPNLRHGDLSINHPEQYVRILRENLS